MNQKPHTCLGCPLHPGIPGFVPAAGPARPLLTVVTDSPDPGSLRIGLPLTGDGSFNRILSMLGLRRDEVLLGSILSCMPPKGTFRRGSTTGAEAISRCRTHLDRLLAAAGPVVVAAGELAVHALTDIPSVPKATLTELHGHVLRDPAGRFWVVPTFPFENLTRGAANLTGIVLSDLRRALQVARHGHTPSEPTLVEDPDLAWFQQWAEAYVAAAEANPQGVWLAVDIETLHGSAASDLPSWTILRINFSCNPDEGITVPWGGPYEQTIRKVLASPGVKVFWNWRFDVRRLQHGGFPVGGIILDAKDYWHAYQSDMGGGDDDKQVGSKSGANTVKGNSLGFVAPLASDASPWKHLSEEAPAAYAAKDAVQTLRIILWAVDRLGADRMLDVARLHLAAVDQWVLGPAEEVGLGVDLEALPAFTASLKEKEQALEEQILSVAPEGIGGLYPTNGWATPPEQQQSPMQTPEEQSGAAGEPLNENLFSVTRISAGVEETLSGPLVTRTEVALVKACASCLEQDVAKSHVCKETYTKRGGGLGTRKSKTLTPSLYTKEISRPRYYIRLPFNPRSSDQMRSAITAMQLELGKGDTADKLTLKRLLGQCLARVAELKTEAKQREWQRKADFFRLSLAHREISKIEGTYATGTLKRIEAQRARGLMDDRLHPTFSNAPSTLRTSCVPLTTEILTAQGWKTHDQLTVGELVVGYDVLYDRLKLTPLEAVHYKSDVVGSVTLRHKAGQKSNFIRCTPDHNWVVQAPFMRGFMRADGLFVGRGQRKIVLGGGGELPDGDSDITVLEAAIIGWAITDGHVRAALSGNGYYMQLTLAKPKSIAAARELLTGIKHTEHTYPYVGPSGPIRVQFYIGNKEFTPIWEKALRQPLDAMVVGLSQAARAAMYEAMMEADGSRTRDDERFGAQKQPVKDVFAALCAVMGRHVAYKTRRFGFTDFQVHQDRHHGINVTCWQAPETSEPERVWCPQTGTGTWVMRSPEPDLAGSRGMGHIAVTGNCKAPNLQNVAADRAGEDHPASGFRKVIVAAPGHVLIEADFSAIEAVLVGYFANDPVYYRNARMGVHAIMASKMLAAEGKWEAIDESWEDARVKAAADALKASTDHHVESTYTGCKRTIHMTGFGGTPPGMVERMPDLFPTRAVASKFQNFYFNMAPKVRGWQLGTQEFAAKHHYVGGPSHPFHYRHWFWDVHRWERVYPDRLAAAQARGAVLRQRNGTWFEIRQGEDSKRAIAFLPQSTAAGIIRLCSLRLFTPPEWRGYVFGNPDAFMESYIGDLYGGRTPLRAIIHDSFLIEVPEAVADFAITCMLREMRRPVKEMPLPWKPDEYLTLDAAVKQGVNWAPASSTNPYGMKKWKAPLGEAAPSAAALDSPGPDAEEDEEDEDVKA